MTPTERIDKLKRQFQEDLKTEVDAKKRMELAHGINDLFDIITRSS
jgi:hypothetical protein